MSAWARPERLFLLFAIPGGLILLALIPPLFGGNETYNFGRAAAIANGHMLIEPAWVPRGIADMIALMWDWYPQGSDPPYGYSARQFAEMAAFPPGDLVRVDPNPIGVLHPVSYLPQAPAIALGQALGLSPLALFYLGRAAGLAAGIGLTFAAIRIIPAHKYALAALALLPPILFSRSTLDADQLNNGLAFLFIALLFRACAVERVGRGLLAALAVAAFLLAQAKSAYLLLPFLALAIPASKFGSPRAKWVALALIVLPGLAASLAWMLSLKGGYFSGVRYKTYSGIVFPDAQMAAILRDPMGFFAVFARTLFDTSLIPTAFLQFLGVFGPPVSVPFAVYPVLIVLLAGTLLSDRSETLRKPRFLTILSALAALGSVTIVLVLLYVQWTRLGAPLIEGFNGRYLYPLAPLALLALRRSDRHFFGQPPARWLIGLAAVSLAVTVWTSATTYYG